MKRSDAVLVASFVFLFAAIMLLRFSQSAPDEQPQTVAESYQPTIALQQPATEATLPQNKVAVALDYQAHVSELRKTVGDEFTIVVEKPFVVIGDESAAQVNQWASGTIRWAVAQIKDQYFEKDPDHIINIWLFKDKRSYESNTKALFGSTPSTPYGYYSPSDKALVMNISTGGGTLVHEIVHPFMSANFDRCPSWFNEGLASLYEQSAERNGTIVGLTNWRLRGLQFAIRDGLLGSFEKLMSTNDREFYDGESTNYAQARYLCYSLQQRGLLKKYYHQFVANAKQDPEGIETLKRLLRTEDLEGFQSLWEQEVLKLRFP